MDMVRMYHPKLDRAEPVPESAVGQHALAGWVPASEDGETPKCPTCRQDWPAQDPPPEAEQTDKAPATAGASSSEPPRRRKTSKESDV